MAYFVVVGFLRTQDIRAYAWRLGIFAIISEPAYVLYNASIVNNFTAQTLLSIVKHGNVLFSLLLSLFALIALNMRMHIGLKVILLSAIAIIIQQMDYGLGMLFWVLLFYRFYNSCWLVIIYIVTLPIAYVLIYGFHQTVGLGFMHYGMILTGLLIYLYNGNKGATWGGRYLFYIFYPVHLLILSIVMRFH